MYFARKLEIPYLLSSVAFALEDYRNLRSLKNLLTDSVSIFRILILLTKFVKPLRIIKEDTF